MNAFTVLHRTAMEFYDLAGIYKAKGQTEFLKDYQERAWLLEQEAALQVLAQPDDFTFKYIIVHSAGKLGYDIGQYEDAKSILQLGLMSEPSEIQRHEMELLLERINEQIIESNKEDTEQVGVLNISGTLTAADIQDQKIAIREQGKEHLSYIKVSVDSIKKVLRFSLGEWVNIQLKENQFGEFDVKNIARML